MENNNQQVCTPGGMQGMMPTPQQMMSMAQPCMQQMMQMMQPYMPMIQQMMQQYMPMIQQMMQSMGMPAMPFMGMGAGMGQPGSDIFDKYYSKKVDKPIEKPNVIKLTKAKVKKPTKTPEQALDTVLSLILPNCDKDKSFFEQGMSSFDVIKLITRCGENGYIVEMKDVFKTPTYNELVKKMKPGE